MRHDLRKQFGHENYFSAANGLVSLLTRKVEQCMLLNLAWNIQPVKERWDVSFPRIKLLLKPSFAHLPTVGVHRRFDVNQMSRLWLEGHNVKLTIVATLGPPANISTDEISAEFVPLRDQLLKIVVRHWW